MASSISNAEITELYNTHKVTAKKLKHSKRKERIDKLNKILSYLNDNTNEKALLEAMKTDLGRAKIEVLISEVNVVVSIIKYIKCHLRDWMKDERVVTSLALTGATSVIHKEAKGSALIISPWNYPFQLAIVPLCYAIAAGNTVVIKPSEHSKATSSYIADMISNLFDPKEIAVVQGAIPETQMLLAQAWNHIYFTGSPAVGKIIMKAASAHLSSVTLELGGKSPCIIDDSANIKTAAKRLTWAKYFNNGQTCIAPDYVLVSNNKKAALVTELKKQIEAQLDPNGKGIQNNKDYGRIINKKHHTKCVSLLEDAVSKGANIIVGGQYDLQSKYFAPTVIDQVDESMSIMQEEIFGPILPIVNYESKENAIKIIANLPKPLALYIMSNNQKVTDYYINNTTAGGTVINDFLIHYSNPNLPFGGVNNSGIGKSHGYYGFQAFTNERAIMKQKFGLTNLFHPPYTNRTEKIAKFVLKFLS